MFIDDREFIENKFHKTDEEFNAFARMAYHGYDYGEGTGLEDEEILKGLEEMYDDIKELPHPTAKAYAVRYVLENTKADVLEHDMFVGIRSLNRLANSVTMSKYYDEVFSKLIPETAELMDDLNRTGAVTIWPDFDHVVPDWNSVLTLGFGGIANRARKFKQMHEEDNTLTEDMRAVYDGVITEYEAIVSLTDRLYKRAILKKFDGADKIAECLGSIRDGAPKNIYEAMQVIYIYFLVSECFDSYQVRSLGNGLDNSLYGFYKRDIENGTFTREEIKELLKYFLMQWSAIGNYWGQPFYMGGTDKNGDTKYNELSYMILDVYDELGIYNPKIQLKVNTSTPDKILFKALDMVRRGQSSIVFCCENGLIRAVMSYGATYDEALNMDIRGCYETGVRANEVSTGTGYINSVKAVLYALSNGYDETLSKQFGPKTGKMEELETFDDFYNAVLCQWKNLIELTIKAANSYERYLSRINPSNMYTGTIEGAIKKGTDAYQSGVRFNNSAILNCGFASLVDSVMAVKEFVYDKKEISLSELAVALKNNWSGYETLRTKILKSCHKYGNNDFQTDIYSEALAAYFSECVNHRPNARGGIYKSIMHSALQFVEQGRKTGATPDGRFSGEELSKNASACVGADKSGVTALINSAAKTRPYSYIESHCLDVTLHPSAVEGDEGLGVMKSLIFTYMDMGGQSMQFNVFNEEMLKDAQKNPEKYKNLQVRVCGWNVLWNNLSEQEQNAYIKRAAVCAQ